MALVIGPRCSRELAVENKRRKRELQDQCEADSKQGVSGHVELSTLSHWYLSHTPSGLL